ncbi:mediator of RNA polymerase II transcription subunit 9 isoform X2 [Rhinatrema bivittatum]|uniref:mediator of RNA polymerase II transcription subunit 9 isoform X2 n=1 Tax=Rhinatrema bivittatum TaxID=194408 RepID=UPI00112BD407|nr:mediator of RNA polymerase II transcription subunit 9 isoform X2 [Rhinatrema bivittatum]
MTYVQSSVIVKPPHQFPQRRSAAFDDVRVGQTGKGAGNMATGGRPAEGQEDEEEEEEDYSFLPLVHDIIKCMDKDSQDVHQELSELKNKFQEMRKLISSMPGIDRSPEQQQQQLQSLREQVRTKNQLLQKYKSLCMLEIPKE